MSVRHLAGQILVMLHGERTTGTVAQLLELLERLDGCEQVVHVDFMLAGPELVAQVEDDAANLPDNIYLHNNKNGLTFFIGPNLSRSSELDAFLRKWERAIPRISGSRCSRGVMHEPRDWSAGGATGGERVTAGRARWQTMESQAKLATARGSKH